LFKYEAKGMPKGERFPYRFAEHARSALASLHTSLIAKCIFDLYL
jgi:hypothetical protein